LRETRPRKMLRAKTPSTQSEKSECISEKEKGSGLFFW